jgi:hypothetical protein
MPKAPTMPKVPTMPLKVCRYADRANTRGRWGSDIKKPFAGASQTIARP